MFFGPKMGPSMCYDWKVGQPHWWKQAFFHLLFNLLQNNNDQVTTPLSPQSPLTPIKSVLKKTSPLSRNDVLHQAKKNWAKTNYFKNIKVHRNSLMYRGAMMNIHRYRLRASSCPNIYKNSMTTLAKEDEEVSYISIFCKIKIFTINFCFRNGIQSFWKCWKEWVIFPYFWNSISS